MNKDQIRICSLYDEDGRYFEFKNSTGRTVILSSKSRDDSGGELWSAGIVIGNGDTFIWKFLGESASVFQDYFLMMPDSYLTSYQNSFQWIADYVDIEDYDYVSRITFNFKTGPLELNSLPKLKCGEKMVVVLQRSDKSIPSLESISKEKIAFETEVTDKKAPKLLLKHLRIIKRKHGIINANQSKLCSSCHGIHLFNLRCSKNESFHVKHPAKT